MDMDEWMILYATLDMDDSMDDGIVPFLGGDFPSPPAGYP